jgi:predicted RNA binding protein YcfA (HicA-like mRNA interferase family)
VKSYGSKEQALIRDGWYIVDTTGSHVHLKNQNKPGKVTVPHLKKNLTKKGYKFEDGSVSKTTFLQEIPS